VPTDCIGSPDAPAFRARPALFIISLLLFAIWMAVLIYWAIQVRDAAH
jgi:hypothetical protein